MLFRPAVPIILLYFSIRSRSILWNEDTFIEACELHENLNRFTNYSSDLNKILTCVAGFHNFDPNYVLKLEGGINCSGLYGLESSVLESCARKRFHDRVDCFVYAQLSGEFMATIRYNVCLTLFTMADNQSADWAQDLRAVANVDLSGAIPNYGFNAVICVKESQVTTLILPGEYSIITVAAHSYDESLRRLNRRRDEALDKLSCAPYR